MIRPVAGIGLATATLVALHVPLRALEPASAPANVPTALLATSTMLAVAALWSVGTRIGGGVPRLATILFALWGSIAANYLVEALVFDIGVPAADKPWLVTHALASTAVAGLVIALAIRLVARAPDAAPAMPLAIPWRTLLGCGLLYVVLYMAAGSIIAWPVVQPFYEQRPLPGPGVVLPLQVLRGAAFGATILLVTRTVDADRATLAMTSGILLSVLGGASPLLLPSAYMPDLVRFAHLAEVVVSNFVFGAMAGWWLSVGQRTGHGTMEKGARRPSANPGPEHRREATPRITPSP